MTSKISPFSSRSRFEQVTICPCCGVKFAGDFSNGCVSCGAQSVGEPLPKPEQELPSYSRALMLATIGSLMVSALVAQIVIAFFQRVPFSFSFWSLAIAAQTAAWRMKWVAIPATLFVLFVSRRIYKSILRDSVRFCGLRYARGGFTAAALSCGLVATLIGVSVPARLRHRQWAIEAAYNARVYRLDRAFVEYGNRYHSLPSDPQDLLKSLPDPDGSLAAALNGIGPLSPGAYKPSGADLAALPQRKPRTLQGLVIRNASVDSSTDDRLPTGWSFTNYELRLAGPDKIPGTEDDLIVRDGLITKTSEAGPGVIGSTASTNAIKP